MRISFLILLAILSLPVASQINSLDCENNYFKSKKPSYAETEEERIDRLERELEDALSQFDECLDDSDKSKNSSNSSSSNSATSSNGSANSTISGDLPSNKQPKNQKKLNSLASNIAGTENSSSKDGISGNVDGKPTSQMNNGSIPKDIPLLSDDDIVAVQLREMAMSEQDLELKEKYWDKYREYKGIKKGEKK